MSDSKAVDEYVDTASVSLEATPLLLAPVSPNHRGLQRLDDSDDDSDFDDDDVNEKLRCRFVRKNPFLCLLLFASLVVLFIAFALKPIQDSIQSNRRHKHRHDFIADACSVYCHGELLKAVQTRGLFPDDDKTFVDMPMKADPQAILSAFMDLGSDYTTSALADFVTAHFDKAGSDIEVAKPVDWREELPFAKEIANKTMADFATAVHQIWPQLARKLTSAALDNPVRHSTLPLPHPFIMPGGRFREQYYWDTYFVVRGLIISDMFETARNTVDNFAHIVRLLGYVPNGMRVYYTTRSQPPLLSAMVRLLHNVSQDLALLKDVAPALATERDYWTLPPCTVPSAGTHASKQHCRNNSKSVTITTPQAPLTFARYYASTIEPRPESYSKDVKLADDHHIVAKAREDLFRNLATGAETGWDFSSRWLSDVNSLATIRASRIVPADLNAYLVDYDRNMAFIADKVGWKNSSSYRAAADARASAMMAVMYNHTTGRWNDLLLPDGKQITDRYSVASYIPLWANVTQDQSVLKQVVDSLQASTGLLEPGGLVTTLTNTSQQWDSPAAWAPMQLLLVDGLAKMETPAARTLRQKIMCRFLNSMVLGFKQTGYMFEKYDAYHPGRSGSGGEYKPQLGFGWTNGVMLTFMKELRKDYDHVCLTE